MIRPLLARFVLMGRIFLAILSLLLLNLPARAQAPAAPALAENVPGQFFTIVEPITTESIAQLKATTRPFVERNAAKGQEPVLVFEILPGEHAPGASGFGSSIELAEFISTRLGEAKHRIAFVPKPLKGYAVLAALACDEIVMGTGASLGPISTEPPDDARRAFVTTLAKRQGHDPDLFLGMLEPDKDLRAVRTADRQLHFEFAQDLPAFKKTAQVVEESAAWEGGQRGVLTTARAREMGFAKWTADSRAEVAGAYRINGRTAADDPTLGQEIRPVIIDIREPFDKPSQAHLLGRHIEKLRQQGVNLLIFKIDTLGGSKGAADALADLIVGIKDMKTVAYVEDRALGFSALAALACSEIVFRKDAQLGDIYQVLLGRNNNSGGDPEARDVQSLALKAGLIAEQKGHSAAIARAMVDPEAVLVEAKDAKTGAPCFVLQSEVEADPQRFLAPEVRKQAGHPLTIKASEAASFGLGEVVNDLEELKASYGLRGKAIRVEGPNWVDTLVMTLTDPLVSWLLLFIGLFMLVLELKLPGIGLPAITSALAFMLFFWSHYLSGTADQLEIILFLVGMACLGLELFVFPGFGVFGMSGVLLILSSIVMASHTFVWPTEEYEYREMGYTMIQLTVVMVAVGAGAVVLGRYFPSIPFLNRLVLKPEPWTAVGEDDLMAKPAMEGYESLAFLVGETGRTTTTLRPSGKARFGDMLLDVTADGSFIEPDSLIEVVEVLGAKVIVKQVDA